jgi:hypothetical protein
MTRRRMFALMIVLASAVGGVAACAAAQRAELSTQALSFSSDGRLLREVQREDPAAPGTFWRIHAMTYDAATGATIHALDLGPGTQFLDATSDGRTAVIADGGEGDSQRGHLSLVDMDTGQKQDIPRNWFDADDENLWAQVSAEGRLVSAFGGANQEVVTVYDWPTKKLVAKQTAGFPAGGAAWGGVTADGKIEFLNSRTGGDVVDPQTGRVLVELALDSYRSVDGAWVIDFPNLLYGDAPRAIFIKNGLNGDVVGKLDIKIANDEEEGSWSWARGAFCGTSGRFIAASKDTVQAFAIPSGKKLAELPVKSWRDPNAINSDNTVTVACSPNGKRVAVRNGVRLTLHNLE